MRTKYTCIAIVTFATLNTLLILTPLRQKQDNASTIITSTKRIKMKYVLLLPTPKRLKFLNVEVSRERHCPVNNCLFTTNETLKPITEFDAILLNGEEYSEIKFPTMRSPHQKYVFFSMESSHNYPYFNHTYNNMFNWTFTYKLNSDEYCGYIIVKNKSGYVIGPKKDMHWLEFKDMKVIDKKIKNKLKTKKIAAAWFVSYCNVKSKREEVAKKIEKELAKYNMTLDIFGYCGKKKCSKNKMDICLKLLRRYYYFYLAFENSFSEDYVTEKVLHALQNYAVPIVYGGANYTRFLPKESYLDARTLNIEELVTIMADSIKNKEKYYDFFRWTNHYSFHEPEHSPHTDYYCNFCKRINDENLVKQISIYKDFLSWWEP